MPRLGVRKALPKYDPWSGIEEKKTLYRPTILLILMILLFIFLEQIGIRPETIALGCAVLSLAISGFDPAEIFRGLDWETIFFLGDFFFLVKGTWKKQGYTE